MELYNAKTLSSILKRKGGEGKFTTFYDGLGNTNKIDIDIIVDQKKTPMLICYYSATDWLLIYRDQMVVNQRGQLDRIDYARLTSAKPALKNEVKAGKYRFHLFTRINLKLNNGKEHMIRVESGNPYAGVLAMLRFVCQRNGLKEQD